MFSDSRAQSIVFSVGWVHGPWCSVSAVFRVYSLHFIVSLEFSQSCQLSSILFNASNVQTL